MEPPSLPDELGHEAGGVNIVLFSQPDCAFCHVVREHYLRPLAASRSAGLRIVEVPLDSTRTLVGWGGQRVTHTEFARMHGARFAPTVMFLSALGRELAPPIVGLSRDFFGAYLDARIAQALVVAHRDAGAGHEEPSRK